MSLTVKTLTMTELTTQPRLMEGLRPPFPFVASGWLAAWYESFGDADELWLRLFYADKEPVGLATLRVSDGTARFIGSANVCDYLDFVVKEGWEDSFFERLLAELAADGARRLELEALRPDSTVITRLLPLARRRGLEVKLTDTDVTLEMALPSDWDTYLLDLTAHQRHEIKRKGRRLTEAGKLEFEISEPRDREAELAELIRLLRVSRQDKAEFMTAEMEKFFCRLAAAMQDSGWLKFGHLRLDGLTVASVMCFDYNETRYLYNSGYEPARANLSVGLLSKVFSIQDAVARRMRRYDFLKGAEVYKYHLGGGEMPIARAEIELNIE